MPSCWAPALPGKYTGVKIKNKMCGVGKGDFMAISSYQSYEMGLTVAWCNELRGEDAGGDTWQSYAGISNPFKIH